MGGKSRKTGAVSKKLISRIKKDYLNSMNQFNSEEKNEESCFDLFDEIKKEKGAEDGTRE